MERRSCLEPRHDAATSVIERSPPAIVIIAEVEDVSGTSLDRHRLGCGDIVDIGLGDHVIDRTAEVGIVDHMRLGAADIGRKARPIRAGARQMQAGRVDQAHGIVQFATQAARRHRQHMHEKTREYLRITAAVGVRKGRTRRGDAARMIKPPLMALHRIFDVAQRAGARQLAIQQRQKLTFGRETTHQLVAAMVLHKLVERSPGNEFQNVAKHSIRMRHGADPFHVQLSRKTLDTIKINAVHLAQQKSSRTAVGLSRASTSFFFAAVQDVDGRA